MLAARQREPGARELWQAETNLQKGGYKFFQCINQPYATMVEGGT